MTSGEGVLGIADQNRPLTSAEREQFLAALEDGDLLDVLLGRGLLYTGLSSPTFAHIRPDWLRQSSEKLGVFVPGYEIECDLGGTQGPARGRGDRPCSYCAEKNDGKWQVRRYESRYVPIADDRTKEAFRKWFNLHDRVGGHALLYERLTGPIADRTGIERLSPRVLRHTFAVILVEKRFPVDVAVELLGYPGSWIGPVKYRAYAEHAEGSNPFLCGAPTKRGGSCQEPVETLDGRCWRHEDAD